MDERVWVPYPVFLRVQLDTESQARRNEDLHLINRVAQNDALVSCELLRAKALHTSTESVRKHKRARTAVNLQNLELLEDCALPRLASP